MLCMHVQGRVLDDHSVCAVYVQGRGAGGPYCVCCVCVYRAGVQEDHTVCAVYVQDRGAGGPYCVCCVCMYRAGCWMTILCVLCMSRKGVQEDFCKIVFTQLD